MYRLVTVLFFSFAATVSALAQSSLPVPSFWTNQRGSEMKLYSMDAQGNLSGVYINHAAGFSCQGTPYALTGRAVGSSVSFTVVWSNSTADCHSKTVWHGHVHGNTIPTRWLLIGVGFPPQNGTDVFQQQP